MKKDQLISNAAPKKLTVADLKKITGGNVQPRGAKAEDNGGNKAEAGKEVAQ